MLRIEVHKTVVPLIGYQQEGPTLKFLGTSFFVQNVPTPLLVTANHVIEGWDGGVGILVPPDPAIYEAELIARHPEVDLALLRVRVPS